MRLLPEIAGDGDTEPKEETRMVVVSGPPEKVKELLGKVDIKKLNSLLP